jgi:hypothetical protein
VDRDVYFTVPYHASLILHVHAITDPQPHVYVTTPVISTITPLIQTTCAKPQSSAEPREASAFCFFRRQGHDLLFSVFFNRVQSESLPVCWNIGSELWNAPREALVLSWCGEGRRRRLRRPRGWESGVGPLAWCVCELIRFGYSMKRETETNCCVLVWGD